MKTKTVECTLSCLIDFRVGGDHAYCTCPCHKTLPAIPPSRKRVHVYRGSEIKNLLQDLRLVLVNAHGIDADYRISARGVPLIEVNIDGNVFSICFFGRSQLFRLFLPNGRREDVKDRSDVITYFVNLKNDLL